MSDFKAKMHQIRFPLGLCPRTSWGSLQHSLDLLTVFKGATSKGTEGKGEEKEREGREGVHLTHFAFQTLAALPLLELVRL